MARVLLVLDEPLLRPDGRMAGLQVRMYEMGRALVRKGHEVLVSASGDHRSGESHEGLKFVSLETACSERALDAWIAHPLSVRRHHGRLRTIPLIVDGYESPFGSFLHHAGALLPRLGNRAVQDYRRTVAEYLAALELADRVLCANHAQRICYITLLCTLGRISPYNMNADAVMLVPSGVPPEPAASAAGDGPRANGQAPPTVLWAGGAYHWFDLPTYVAAIPGILARHPDARFRLAGLAGIDGGADAGVEPLLAGLPPLVRTQIEVAGWVPYAERAALYDGVDVSVCTYGDHLETTFSIRARLLDSIWAAVPVVASAGDELSDQLAREGAAATVPPGDAVALGETIADLLADSARRQAMRHRAGALSRSSLSWDTVVEPLNGFLCRPSGATVSAAPDRQMRRTVRRVVRASRLGYGPVARQVDRVKWWLRRRLAGRDHPAASTVIAGSGRRADSCGHDDAEAV